MNVNPNNENDVNLYRTASASSSPSSNIIQINEINMSKKPALQMQDSNSAGNQFSTPVTNQPPPSHQLLQATLIPTISENKNFFRQRVVIPPPPAPLLQPHQFQTPLNKQMPPQMQMQLKNYTKSNDNDQTIETIEKENETLHHNPGLGIFKTD